jgi:hypothetical protein
MLTKLDELNLPDHWYLDGTDDCYFIGEYTAGQGYSHSTTNQLIMNLKKSLDRRGLPEWRYKGQAIRQAAKTLRESLNPEFLRSGTFVPVPPSRVAGDPLYDDRMTQVIRLLGPDVDARELVNQAESMPEAHATSNRPGPEILYANYRIQEPLLSPVPVGIAVVDDVLTTGAHFKAMKRILRESCSAPIVGIFLARRVPDSA